MLFPNLLDLDSSLDLTAASEVRRQAADRKGGANASPPAIAVESQPQGPIDRKLDIGPIIRITVPGDTPHAQPIRISR